MTGHNGTSPSNDITAQQTIREPAWFTAWVLVACTGVSILSTDLYAPSLPHLPNLLGSDAKTVQLTMSLNLGAYAVAQLVHGPLADYHGRRRLLLFAMLGFIAASLLCALAQDIGGLLVGRVAQGLFSSVPSVVVVIMIRELYVGYRAVKVMALYGMATGLVPAAGPLIGGYVFVWAGWRVNFLLLAGLAAIVFFLVLRLLPESGTRDPAALRVGRIARIYFELLAQRVYWRYVLPLATIVGAFYAFITAGPFLMIDLFGVATQNYGVWYGVSILAFVAGGLVANRLGSRLSADTLVRIALAFSCSGGLALLLITLTGNVGPASLIACLSLLNFGMAIIFASGPFCIFDALPGRPLGPTSALLGSIQLGAASLGSLLVGTFHDGTALPLAVTMAGMVAAGGFGYLVLGLPRR